jgi:hypothetical protein
MPTMVEGRIDGGGSESGRHLTSLSNYGPPDVHKEATPRIGRIDGEGCPYRGVSCAGTARESGSDFGESGRG